MNKPITQEDLFGVQTPPAAEEARPPQELIVVKQLPVIEQQLHLLKAEVESATAAALALECTEDTFRQIKAVRADLNKRRAPFDAAMREIKQQVMAPYAQLETVYKECVASPLAEADRQLKGRIDAVENELKGRKEAEVRAYFEELRTAHGLDFIAFEDVGVKVLMSVSAKAMKEQCKAFVDRVIEDLAAISLHDYRAEILVEYKANGYNQQRATIDVCHRVDAANAERARQEQLAAQREQEAAAAEALRAAAEEYPAPEPLAAPVAEPEPELQEAADFRWVSFKVGSSTEVLRREIPLLKKYLESRGLRYE